MSNPTELPDLDRLRQIGDLIATQDNRYTDQPMFIVQQRRRVYGFDIDYCENVIWLCSEDDYTEASAEEAAKLEAEYQESGRVKSGWQRTGYTDQWEFVTTCFTEQGCKDYLQRDGNNLKEPRIYAEGSYRNEEFRAVRDSLIALARRAKPEGEAPQADDVARKELLLALQAALDTCATKSGAPKMSHLGTLAALNTAIDVATRAAPAAQHAESGAQVKDIAHRIADRVVRHELKTHSAIATVAEVELRAALAAQSQGAHSAPGTPEAPKGGADQKRIDWLIKNHRWSIRWRIHPKKKAEQWQMLDDGEPWGQWGEYRAILDAAMRAAQLDGGQGEGEKA